MSFTFKFTSVGRNKVSWISTLPELCEDSVISEIRKNGRLASRDISIGADDEKKTGTIFAGMHPVGTFYWERNT